MTISVVIPTIGNRDISKTINSINQNNFKVDEILVCTVRNSKIKTLEGKNVKIIFCKEKGQVKQRIEGFKLAKGDYILQLDDDIILNKNCIRLLFDELKNLPNTSISPNVFLSENKNSIFSKKNSLKQKIFNLISGLKLNNREGRITISGFESYPEISSNSDLLTETEWLIGGCVLHHKKNLVLKNYYPFEGKAYSEDLFHSLELRKNKIKLFIHKKASIFLNINENKMDWNTFKKELFKDLRVRRFLVLNNKLSITRMYLVYFFRCMNFFIK